MRKVQRRACGLASGARVSGATFDSRCTATGTCQEELALADATSAGLTGICGTSGGAVFPDDIWQQEELSGTVLAICALAQSAIIGQSGGHFMPESSADAADQQLANANAGEASSVAIISIEATNLKVPFITLYIMTELIT